MNKIKVSFFIPKLELGGAEKIVVRILQALDKNKFQVKLLLLKLKGPLIEELPQEVLVKELKTSKITFALFELIKYFRQEKPDIFVSFLSHLNAISILGKIFSRVKTKVIISERTTFSHTPEITKNIKNKLFFIFLLKPLARIIYPLADAIVCVSKGVAEDLACFLPISTKGKIRVIYNPIVDEKLYDLANEPVEHPWFLNKEIPVILAVGRLSKAKDYPTLLKAFALVRKNKKIRLVIIGDGEERKNLENLINKLNLSQDVLLLGFEKNPYKYMKRAFLFVLSSKVEGFPNVIVEAMACGIPVISTDCPSGPNEIIKNGENGILIPVGDEKALAEAIIKILDDPFLKDKFSREGKKRAEEFTVKKGVNEYEQLFQEILRK